MKDTEVIRILNDLAKDAMGDLKKKICEHIDAILDRMEEEEKKQLEALQRIPMQVAYDFEAGKVSRVPAKSAQDAEQNATKPEQSAQNPPENAQKAKESTGKSSGQLLRSKDIIKENPSGGAKREFDTGKLKALRAGGWTVNMKKEGVK